MHLLERLARGKRVTSLDSVDGSERLLSRPVGLDFDGLRIITRAIRASGATIREIYRVELTPKTVVPVVRCGKVETTTISLQMKLFFRVPNF